VNQQQNVFICNGSTVPEKKIVHHPTGVLS